MKNIQTSTYFAALAVSEFITNPTAKIVALARTLERGDADSTGSTIRTGLVVVIVIGVLATLAAAVSGLGTRIGGKLDGVLK